MIGWKMDPGQHRNLISGVVEMKIDYGPRCRIYYPERAGSIVILLVGGDKTTQSADIAQAIELSKQIIGVHMKTLAASSWDTAQHLKTDEDIAAYLDAVFEEAGNDAAFIAKALGTVARARGMTELARTSGLSRESLYRALSPTGNPEFATVLKVVNALGMRLHASPASTM